MGQKGTPVFINCPFDSDYQPMFRAMLFTVMRCGFSPRCALEVIDGAGTRIGKIEKIIEECRLGIHDMSRTELDPAFGLPRFNMPLELGLFLGARRYGDDRQKRKMCLVLDRERYRYQRFMSDIAGQDIESHEGRVPVLIDRTRAFLNASTRRKPLPSGPEIVAIYQVFEAALPNICERLGLDPNQIEYSDYLWMVAGFLSNPPAP